MIPGSPRGLVSKNKVKVAEEDILHRRDTHVCTQYTDTHVSTLMHVHIHIHMNVCMHAHIHTHTHTMSSVYVTRSSYHKVC